MDRIIRLAIGFLQLQCVGHHELRVGLFQLVNRLRQFFNAALHIKHAACVDSLLVCGCQHPVLVESLFQTGIPVKINLVLAEHLCQTRHTAGRVWSMLPD